MLNTVTMYTVVCDQCGASADDGTDYSCWTDETGARETAEANGYKRGDYSGRDYCPECWMEMFDRAESTTTTTTPTNQGKQP